MQISFFMLRPVFSDSDKKLTGENLKIQPGDPGGVKVVELSAFEKYISCFVTVHIGDFTNDRVYKSQFLVKT